jgi:hypothetical protein
MQFDQLIIRSEHDDLAAAVRAGDQQFERASAIGLGQGHARRFGAIKPLAIYKLER